MSAAYLNTRVSLYRQRLWPGEELDQLLDGEDAALPDILARRGLGGLAVGYKGSDPLSLEGRIIAQLLDETRVLLRPLRGDARRFVLYWTERFEVSNLKTLVRAKMAGESAAGVAPRLVDMGPFARLDAERLMHAEDVTELLRRLETSPYADIVRHARQAFEEGHDPFVLDATLDRAYFEGLVHRASALAAESGAPLRALMADLVDRLNLVWLIRYRFNYGLPPAQVYYLLVHAPYRLGPGRLRELVALPDLAAVRAALPHALAQPLDDADDIPGWVARLEEHAARRAERLLAGDTGPLARAFAYLILRERDLRQVRAVLRGRHLRLPVAAMRQLVGRATGAEDH